MMVHGSDAAALHGDLVLKQSLRSEVQARALSAVLLLVSAMQGAFFLLTGAESLLAITSTGLSAAAVLLFVWSVRAKRPLSPFIVSVLVAAQLAVFARYLLAGPLVADYRLLQVAIIVVYCATIVSFAASLTRVVAAPVAFLLCGAMAVGIVLGEVVLEFATDHGPYVQIPQWWGSTLPHPTLGAVYAPHSLMKTYYPDNPRGYFRTDEGRDRAWIFGTDTGVVARIAPVEDAPNVMRVEVDRRTAESWGAHLRRPGLALTKGATFTLAFRARASHVRRIGVGIGQAHPPWEGLGFYEDIELRPDWQSFTRRVVATAADDNAQVQFNLAADTGLIEIEDVTFRNIDTGAILEPATVPPAYVVTYRFNSAGCRGRDYAVPRPSNTVRVLLLGDSYTLGVGVHEEDTFASVLERSLNASSAPGGGRTHYEVINCGVSGYGTRDERAFYELFGAAYAPDVVLLIMAWNDDISFLDEVRQGYAGRRRRAFESLFRSVAMIQDWRYRRPEPDFTQPAREVARLAEDVRRRDGRFGVVLFRLGLEPLWLKLNAQVTEALKNSSVPILDLERPFSAEHSYDQLTVHAGDGHLNEVAHAIAAREIATLLREKLLAR